MTEVEKVNERLCARTDAADRYKRRIPTAVRQCAGCGWRPPEILLRRNKRLFLLHAHHIIAVSRGGSDSNENLILLCANCHDIADYLSGNNAVVQPITSRHQLLKHLTMLLTDPEQRERQEAEQRLQVQGALSRMLADRHDD